MSLSGLRWTDYYAIAASVITIVVGDLYSSFRLLSRDIRVLTQATPVSSPKIAMAAMTSRNPIVPLILYSLFFILGSISEAS